MYKQIGDGICIDVGVYVLRGMPIHKGHMKAIERMCLYHADMCLVALGSANSPISLYNPFTYAERREMLRVLYPELKVVPIADQVSDDDWFNSLMDIVEAVFPLFKRVNLYCGSPQDVEKFNHEGKVILKLVDRSEQPHLNATDIRNYLFQHYLSDGSAAKAIGHLLEDLVDVRILPMVMEFFNLSFGKILKGKTK